MRPGLAMRPSRGQGVGALLTAIASAILLAPGPAIAGSVFSVGGLGEPSMPEGARVRALGGAGAAEHGPSTFSFINPASTGEVKHFIVEATILPTLRRIDSVSYGGETARETLIPSARAAIVLPGRLALSGAYLIGTDGRFHVDRPDAGAVASSLAIDGTGGMELIRIGLARSAGRGVSLGAEYEIVAGSYREQWVRTFADPTLKTARDTLEASYARQGRWRLGAVLARPRWALGGVLELERRLPLTLTQRTDGAITEDASRSIQIPFGFAVGASASISGHVRAVGQYRRADWNRESLASDRVDFRALEEFSFGVERARRPDAAGWTGRVPLRAGIRHLKWPDRLPAIGASDVSAGAADIDEWALSLGTGIRSKDSSGTVDLALEAGRRGDKSSLGVSERFLRLAISLRVSDETWK